MTHHFEKICQNSVAFELFIKSTDDWGYKMILAFSNLMKGEWGGGGTDIAVHQSSHVNCDESVRLR